MYKMSEQRAKCDKWYFLSSFNSIITERRMLVPFKIYRIVLLIWFKFQKHVKLYNVWDQTCQHSPYSTHLFSKRVKKYFLQFFFFPETPIVPLSFSILILTALEISVIIIKLFPFKSFFICKTTQNFANSSINLSDFHTHFPLIYLTWSYPNKCLFM